MDIHVRQPQLLYLKDTHLSDIVSIEEQHEARLIAAAAVLPPPIVATTATTAHDTEEKIATYFRGITTWVRNTNIKCWQCDRNFHTMPKFVPMPCSEPGVYEVRGNMCSFNCAYSWILLHFAGIERQNAVERLCLLYFMFTGRRISRITQAFAKTEMQQYGGALTEQEFAEKMAAIDPELQRTGDIILAKKDISVPVARRQSTVAHISAAIGGIISAPLLINAPDTMWQSQEVDDLDMMPVPFIPATMPRSDSVDSLDL